ncbi:MAG: putative peptidoglycan glycosyltransferase FtsW [Candidatus Hatepunaea meridiana]|nr:putative peptidoglycan glycosyltransferase FtsW [Candidatus Hatepunaea meridiana]
MYNGRDKHRKTNGFRISNGVGISAITSQGDGLLLISALILTALGLVMVYSASGFVAAKYDKGDWFFFFRQLRFTIIGLGAMLLGAKCNVYFYKKWIKTVLLAFCVVMLLQLWLAPVIGGTKRWIDLWFFRLQTSEVARCLVIIYLARVLTDTPEVIQRLNKQMGKVLGIVIIPVVLTALQPDFSSSMIMVLVAGLVLFVGGLKQKHLIVICVTIISLASILIRINSYMYERLMKFFQPLIQGGVIDYQILQSLLGIGRGGFFGVGLGQGKQKMLFLPEPHTDFIFSIIAEEIGLIGVTFLITAIFVLILRSCKMLQKQPDRYKFLLGTGLAGSLTVYALVNMYVATGIFPVTGIPLPFISSGGTSLVISLWSVGVLWNLSRNTGDYL